MSEREAPPAGAEMGSFGGYRILSELGRGGMGVVYEAFDPEMDRRVALKVLPAGLKLDEKSVARLRREARIVGKLHHPNVVSVYATGIDDGTPYIAMELVEGESLAKVLERRRPDSGAGTRAPGSRIPNSSQRAFTTKSTTAVIPPPEVLKDGESADLDSGPSIPSSPDAVALGYSLRMAQAFSEVAQGLQHAHSRQVIHRDLKPSNLLVDAEGKLRILDFGLARLEGQESLTGSGEVVGTPRYMSPEQVRAGRVQVDHRTDIYSLGATLYEVLTLHPPFQGRTAQETLHQVVHREPRAPRQLGDLDGALSLARQAVQVKPRSARSHYYLGLIHRDRGELAEALRSIRRGLELSRDTAGGFMSCGLPHLTFGEVLEQVGRTTEARAAYEIGIERVERVRAQLRAWHTVLPLPARAQYATGRHAAATRTLEEALEHPATASGTTPRLGALHREYVRAALPDLPTYRSIELALASSSQTALVGENASWKFFKGTATPSAGLEWTQLGFPDETWDSGPGGFGYGDNDDATVLDDMESNYSSLYLRHRFEISDPHTFLRLLLSVKGDDRFVAYLNGREVARCRVPANRVLLHDALATLSAPEPLRPFEIWLDRDSLAPGGANVLAVQGFNRALDSSDFSLIPILKAELSPDPIRGKRILSDFHSVDDKSRDRASRLAYLEGRLFEEGREYERAAERLAVAVERDPTRPEPLVALTRSLRALGRPEDAERHLRRALQTSSLRIKQIGDLWAAVSLADLGRAPGRLLAEFPELDGRRGRDAQRTTPRTSRSPVDELRRLLEHLASRQDLRINCGGDAFEGAGGVSWASDRFYAFGERYLRGTQEFDRDIQDTEDDPLYRTERYFPGGRDLRWPGYRIPLPPARYRIRLHFAEIWYETPSMRVFDVQLEGRRVLERYDPGASGFATASVETFEIAVEDGLLDIEFIARQEYPKISAIEIERVEARSARPFELTR